jgi:hypothetical protein
MGKVEKHCLESIQSYFAPDEVKLLDKKANSILRSRSDTVRLIVVKVLDPKKVV